MKPMDVSIIIVNYNTKKLLLDCLSSLYAQTKGIKYDVFVVDNASTDDSCEIIERMFPAVNLIRNKHNIGFGKANNIAASMSEAEYLFLINSDTIFVNNAAKVLFDFMETNKSKRIGACCGNLYTKEMLPNHSYLHFPTLKGLFFDLLFHYRKKTTEEAVSRVQEIESCHGADMFIKKEVFQQLGGFDPDFFLYYEEMELSYRMKQRGYLSYIVPEAKIIHIYGGSFEDQLYRNNLVKNSFKIYCKKCLGLTGYFLCCCLLLKRRIISSLKWW